MREVNNAQIIKAIGLDDSIKPMAKYTLLICVHVCMDWKTYSGRISADQIAEASSQSSRQVKRHLKALAESGWLHRQSELRSWGLHHKSQTSLNTEKVIEIIQNYDVTERVNHDVTEMVYDVTKKVNHDVTEKVYDVTEKVNAVTERVNHDVTEKVNVLPKMSHISISLNYDNQYKNNIKEEAEILPSSEVEPDLSSEDQSKEWDQAWDKHELEPISEYEDGDYWYVNRIDELEYRREIFKILDHQERYDIRRALWNRSGGDQLFKELMEQKIAPRSVIDWVMVKAGGEPQGSTPLPPEPSRFFTVTVEQQQKIREADLAWMNPKTNHGGSQGW